MDMSESLKSRGTQSSGIHLTILLLGALSGSHSEYLRNIAAASSMRKGKRIIFKYTRVFCS